jgi:DNA-binding IclR family transcriptional regulator
MIADGRFGIQRVAQDSLQRLAEFSGDASFITVRRGSYALCLYREEGCGPGRAESLQPGVRNVLGVGASGLALLAALGNAEVDRTLARNARVLATRYPHLTPAVLRGYVAETQARGYALNRGMVNPHTWGIAVVVHDLDGEPNAALSIGTVAERLGPERHEQLAERLFAEAAGLEVRLHELNMRLRGGVGGPLGSDLALVPPEAS